MTNYRRIIATAALPYANGEIHLGHLVEYLQMDFWTRFQKMRGNECLYICADDTHGTPIMIRARNENRSPLDLIEQSRLEHLRDFKGFYIEFDHFGSTHSNANRQIVEEIYAKNKEHIKIKAIDQLYCVHDKMFLPDRFVKGTCPRCGAKDQHGDSCEKCSSTYSPLELKEPACALCGNRPEPRASDHLMFNLEHFREFLKTWVKDHTPKEIEHKMQEWLFGEGQLKDWDISRDEPYFGFKIPGYDSKYFYVWVDAPVGYISSTAEWCQKHNKKIEDYWKSKHTEIYHCIGKDIVYFHALFWPSLLKNSGYRLPNRLFVHGMLTVNGEKMSKSRGTGISAETYLKHLDPLYLRYYYATKLDSSIDDLDLNLDEFATRVNAELIGKITNLGSRGAQMLSKKLGGVIGDLDAEGLALVKKVQGEAESIAQFYENRDFAKALNVIRSLADQANKYFDDKAPWKTLEAKPEETKEVVSSILNVFRILAIYLKPIIPVYVEKVEKLFKEEPYNWFSVIKILKNHAISDYTHLASRMEKEKIQLMVEETKQRVEEKNKMTEKNQAGKQAEPKQSKNMEAASINAEAKAGAEANDNTEISIEDFTKVDLRIAKILSAESIEGSTKLLKLMVDLGELGERQIFSGIKENFKPEDLVGKLTVVVANLKPRKMKFGISSGMVILAKSQENGELFLLSPMGSGVKPGDKIS